MSIGGSGLTIGLLIAVMIATKRKEMKEIAAPSGRVFLISMSR
ncbi:MAG: hypothetical protein ACLTXH_15935 [Enterobacter hormaechei]